MFRQSFSNDRGRGGRGRSSRGRGGRGTKRGSRGTTHWEREPAAFGYTDYEDDFRVYEEQDDPQIGSSKSFKNHNGYWVETAEMLVAPTKSPKAQPATVSRAATKKNKKQSRVENTEIDTAGQAAFAIRDPRFEKKSIIKKQSGQSTVAGASKYTIRFTKAAVGLNMENQDLSEDLESDERNGEEKQAMHNHESDEEILMQAFEWTEEDANPLSAQAVIQSQADLQLDEEEEGSEDNVETTSTTGLEVTSARAGIGWGGALVYGSNNTLFTGQRDSSALAINRDTALTSSTMQIEVEDRDVLDTIIKRPQIVLDDIETTVYTMNSNGGFDLEEEDKHTILPMIRSSAVEERNIAEEVVPTVEVGWVIDTQGDLNAHGMLISPQMPSENTASSIYLGKEPTLGFNVTSQEYKLSFSNNDNFISVAPGKETKRQKKAKKKAQEQRWRKRALDRSGVAQLDEFISKRKGKEAIIRGDDIDLGDSEDDSDLEALIDYMQNISTGDDAGNYDLAANEQLLKALGALNLPQEDNADLDDEVSELSSNSENDAFLRQDRDIEDDEVSDDDIYSDDDDDEDEEYDLKYFAGHFGWDDETGEVINEKWLTEQAGRAANAKVRKERKEQFERILNGAFNEVPPSLQAGFKARLQRAQKKEKFATNTTGYSNEVNQAAFSLHDARRRDYLEKKRMKAEKKKARREKYEEMAKGKSQHKRIIDLRDTDRTIRIFIKDNSISSLELVPMARNARRQVHLLATEYNLLSRSQGAGQKRYSVLTKTPHTLIPNDRRNIERLINEVRTDISANSSILRHQRMPKVGLITDISGTRSGAGNNKVKAYVKKKGKEIVTESSFAAAGFINGAVVGERARPLGEGNVGHRMLAAMGWKEGDSLGVDNTGITIPIRAVMRSGRSGLGT